MMSNRMTIILMMFFLSLNPGAGLSQDRQVSDQGDWMLHALPSSVRLDPSRGVIIEDRPDLYSMKPLGNLLNNNWIYDDGKVALHAARGEYVSFQLVLENRGCAPLTSIAVEMPHLSKGGENLASAPELFLEWAVEVKALSTGYEKTSLGRGWYPDVLIPLDSIQMDPEQAGRVHYPLELPDFRNRIDDQRFLLIWVDQWVPVEREKTPPGAYSGGISVRIGGVTKTIPVELTVWDFALPIQNTLAGNCQHEGFLRRMSEEQELEVYQLFKRHRVVPADPTYEPSITVSADGGVSIDFDVYENRLKKYFTGEAFTERYGYRDGPGYGQPIEQFVLPFDVYGKHGGGGWPDIVKADLTPSDDSMDMYREAAVLEREPSRMAVYLEAMRQVREYILGAVDPERTDLVVYLNGLDESYFPEAWDRMAYWGGVYKEHFPEIKFRVDGSYSREAMEVIHDAIDYWCCHTIGYDIDTIREYRGLGVTDWLYGPQMYESKKNGWCGSSTFMDLELTNERLISWSCFKYATHTWCSWGIGAGWRTGWYNSETWKDGFRDHGTGPLSYRRYNGNAMVIYEPGVVPRVNRVCASIRLKNMRDGVEEYEMMQLLSELDGDRRRADGVVDSIVYAPYGKAAIGNLEAWNHNPRLWDEARIRLGEMIEGAGAVAP